MRVGVLTSSRADFGIYLPLLTKLKADDYFELSLIVFGTHLSKAHGHTVDQIEQHGFEVKYRIDTIAEVDTPAGIAAAMGKTTSEFASFWNKCGSSFDLIFCLGDRYEMFSAVMAGVPFQLPFAHLHGGETTLGAIDEVFRHAITLASKYHFVSTDTYAQKVRTLTDSPNIYNVGALSLDNLQSLRLLSINQFEKLWGVDLSKKTVLFTFHPETVDYKRNQKYTEELVGLIEELDFQVLITMPNADTAGNSIRKILTENFADSPTVFLIENLGSISYFTAMKYCAFLLGNTSSGIIEAASFNKYVINLGNRQKGRASGQNVIHTPIEKFAMAEAVDYIAKHNYNWQGDNIYYKPDVAGSIIKTLNLL